MKASIGASTIYKTLKKVPVHRARVIFRVFLYLFLISVSFVFLYPFLYMIVTSVKSLSDLNDITVNWIPHQIEFENFMVALRYLNLPVHLKNSLIITGSSTLGHIISCSFIAYGFARFQFKGKGFWFAIVIFTILIPIQVIILPQYSYYLKLGWVNTILPISLPSFLGYGLRGGMYIFVFRQFFMGLPLELEDASLIDGYGYFRTFWKIVLPNVRSAMLVCLFISFVWHWNDYFEPSIYISFTEKLPLPSMLNTVFNGVKDYYTAVINDQLDLLVTDGVIMAAIAICVAPILVVFAFLQRGFTEGIERTGIVE